MTGPCRSITVTTDWGCLGNASCGKPATYCRSAINGPAKRVIVTLSIGKRSHFAVTRIPMQAYAHRVEATLVVVDSYSHPCLARWNNTLRVGVNSHFMKLPLLQYFLQHYDQLLFLDDDVLLSANAPDLFSRTPCGSVPSRRSSAWQPTGENSRSRW